MKNIKGRKLVNFGGNALALIAIVSLTMLGISSESSASSPAGGSAAVQTVSTGMPGASEVKIDNFVFNPAIVTVKVGTQVTWINKDDIPHTVDSTDGKFKSNALDTEDKFQFSFNTPGEYPFFCRMHPKMTGKIIVQP
jgi:plastocyanin